jgi:hypothetical protein
MATMPSFKTKLAPLMTKPNQLERDSAKPFFGTVYYPYSKMNFRPDLTKSSKGFGNSKGFVKHMITYRTFEDYLIEGYGLYSKEDKLKVLNKPAFDLMKKNQRVKQMKDLGLRVN